MLYERAQVHRAQGDYTTAERFYEQAESMQQSVHSPDHPATQKNREALVDLYQAWDKPEKADSPES